MDSLKTRDDSVPEMCRQGRTKPNSPEGGSPVRRSKTTRSATYAYVAALALFAISSTADAHDVEPRYWWQPNVLGRYNSRNEAFLAYKAWEDANNVIRGGTDLDITVIGYELVGTPGTNYWNVNGIPQTYAFRFTRPYDCASSCLGNFMSLVSECPNGTVPVTTVLSFGYYSLYCSTPVKPEPDLKDCPVGNPIFPSTGLKREIESDYQSGAGNLRFTRTYRSDRNRWLNNYQVSVLEVSTGLGSDDTPIACNPGIGQTSSLPFCYRYTSTGQPNDLIVQRVDGRVLHFNSVTGLPSSADTNDRVTRVTNTGGATIGWNVYNGTDDSTEHFDAGGRLQSITYRDGRQQILTYSDAATSITIAPYPGLLIRVTDFAGKQLNFSYDSAGSMQTMTDPSGGVSTYAYDESTSVVVSGASPAGNLTSVTYPNLARRVYWYNEQSKTSNTNLPFALTGITDENGDRYSTYTYDSSGRATSTEHASGLQKYSLSYGTNQATVTDPLGTARSYAFSNVLGMAKNTSVNQPCPGCGSGTAASTSYDSSGNVSSRTDFNGNITNYTYDLARNLETSRTEAFGTSRARTIATQWHLAYRIPTLITEPGKTTAFTHDANGNVLTKTVTDTATGTSRTWTYTYNGVGQILTVNGSRTDVADITTYAYYNCTTGYQCGQVQTVTNALSQITTYNTYNANGQPLTITDPNGVVTTLAYDLRQRLTSRTVGAEQTTLQYWPTGLLKKVTMPDSSYLLYTYDAAHRLTDVTDTTSNNIHYTLDAMGNRTKEEAFDPGSTLSRTRSRVFDTLNRLSKEIGAAGTVAVTTTFGYDTNGNQTSISAPLSRNTAQTYDELNRLSTVTDPGSGVTTYGYDALDQLISVTDPRSLATTYTYNGLGDLKQQGSPDTATTTNTFDSGGSLQTSTDARSAITTYTYDVLNRVKTAAFKIGATTDQTITYNYDAGTNGKGHLTSASDSTHSMAWTYDALGRVTGKSQVVGGVTKSAGYAYVNGQLTTLTTPSGQVISYGYTNNQIISISVNGTTILSGVVYEPFGPPKQWTWGNATVTTRGYDTDGKVTQIVSADTHNYSYDDAFRITGIADTANSALSWTYGYDLMDRLNSATKTGTAIGFTFDANGNRLSQTGSSASTYTVSATSNRVGSIAGALPRTYGYNAAGNTTSYETKTLAYNNRGRLKSLTNSGTTTTYVYDALGQLVQKTGARFFYDEAGHLLGLYLTTGALTYETVWMGDIPVAALYPKTGGGVDIFYIHTDHLDTPRKITRPSDNKARWRWDSDPFGTTAANENPEALGVFKYGLRFPGQIYLSEAGLHYNYYRDYDSATGRYVESDPIGLGGGLNTFAYVSGNPIEYIDPTGQDLICQLCHGPTPPSVVPPLGWPNVSPPSPTLSMPTDGPGIQDFPGLKDKAAANSDTRQCPDDECDRRLAELTAQVESIRLQIDLHAGKAGVRMQLVGLKKQLKDFNIDCPQRRFQSTLLWMRISPWF